MLGGSNIVGRPISYLLSLNGYPVDCKVTACHSRTKNIPEIPRTADIVKEGAVVIDVDITRVKSDNSKNGWKLLGDVKFDDVAPKCSYITPVPGGVGLLTIVSL